MARSSTTVAEAMEFEIAADGAAFDPEHVELRAEGLLLEGAVASLEKQFSAAQALHSSGEAI
jgi:hypothetical protein